MRIDRYDLRNEIHQFLARQSDPGTHTYIYCRLEGEPDLGALMEAVGRVNAEAFCTVEAPPGTVMMQSIGIYAGSPGLPLITIEFGYRPAGWKADCFWPGFPGPPIDFNALFPEAETWRDRPPLL